MAWDLESELANLLDQVSHSSIMHLCIQQVSCFMRLVQENSILGNSNVLW